MLEHEPAVQLDIEIDTYFSISYSDLHRMRRRQNFLNDIDKTF